ERGSAIRPGEQLGHLLMVAELHGLVCSGPVKGVHHSYALVDEVVPTAPSLEQDEAHRELVRRFFTGHGPATVKDFTRWSSLTVAGTRTALAELGDTLEQVVVDGIPHWFDPAADPRRSPAAPAAYLLPTYDEVVLSYRSVSFPAAADHPYAEHPDPFWAQVVLDQRNVGLWKRTVRGDAVAVDLRLADSVDEGGRAAVRAAAQRLADFLGKELELT
ncbi:MAG: crosslink repair DNA glycosylase YcaQ family protein, partial [Pedococcus sp.]